MEETVAKLDTQAAQLTAQLAPLFQRMALRRVIFAGVSYEEAIEDVLQTMRPFINLSWGVYVSLALMSALITGVNTSTGEAAQDTQEAR